MNAKYNINTIKNRLKDKSYFEIRKAEVKYISSDENGSVNLRNEMITEKDMSSDPTNISVGSKEADKYERISVAGVNEKGVGLPKDSRNAYSGEVDVGKALNDENVSNDQNHSEILLKKTAKDVFSHVKIRYYKMLILEYDKICPADAKLYEKVNLEIVDINFFIHQYNWCNKESKCEKVKELLERINMFKEKSQNISDEGFVNYYYFPLKKVETEVIFNDDNELGKLK